MDVKNAEGKTENWAIEAGRPNILLRRGITKDTLKQGDKIVVEGYQSKDGSHRRQRPRFECLRTGSNCSWDLRDRARGAPYSRSAAPRASDTKK